jgi:hypothetical protein
MIRTPPFDSAVAVPGVSTIPPIAKAKPAATLNQFVRVRIIDASSQQVETACVSTPIGVQFPLSPGDVSANIQPIDHYFQPGCQRRENRLAQFHSDSAILPDRFGSFK